MKIYINTDVEHYGLSRFLVKNITDMGYRNMDDEDPDIVLNIDSVEERGFRKGKKLTLYLEGDEFTTKGVHTNRYDMTDILYILQKNYLSYYPNKTRILNMGVDPSWHYPRDVKKEYDYVFVGRTTGNDVYDHRKEVLEDLQKSKYKILVTPGTPYTYCDLLSSGRIILNVLPRRGNDVCANYRILEGMAIGCVMTDYDPSLDDWGIKPNVHYLPLERFGDISDEEIKKIHETGRAYVLKHFSYKDAVLRIIKDIETYER